MRFTGLLSRAVIEDLNMAALKDGHVARPLEAPHRGLVIRMPEWQPNREMLEPYLEAIGVAGADWLFLAYETWSGPVDYVQRYGQIGPEQIESVSAYDQRAQRLYADLMERFGLADLAEDFPPFRRGYCDWSERV